MVTFPQRGSCLCGDLEYSLREDPLTLYVCHCTDCQTLTGASFTLSLIVRREALEFVRGELRPFSVELPDGRVKRFQVCSRCATRIWSASSAPMLALLEPGTLEDTSWLRPVAHIWTRSAQPWIPIPDDSLKFSKQSGDEGSLAMVRAWKERQA